MKGFIKGERLYLRSIEESDANETYLSWINDSEVTKGLEKGTYPSSMNDLVNYLKSVINNPSVIMFAVCVENGEHIGNIKLDRINSISRTAEMGLMIGSKAHWGKGLGKEMCQLVLDYAWNELNLRKISLTVYGNNPNAVRLYEKLGFKVEGRLKDHVYAEGAYHDKLWMSVFNHNER